jgi:hypothetical protein
MPPRRRPRAGGPLHLPAQPALIVNYLPNSVLGQYQGICLSSVPLAPIYLCSCSHFQLSLHSEIFLISLF